MPVIDSTLIPSSISSGIIAAASEQSVVLKLANKQPMPTGVASVPVLQTLPVSGWVNGHGGRKPATTVEWSSEQLVPEEVAAVVAVPQSLIDDAGVPIWPAVQKAVVDALTFSIDSAILFGDNAPASFPTDGIVGQAIAAGRAVHGPVVGPPATDLAEAINQAMGDVENDGLMPTGDAADVSLKSKLRGLRDDNGNPIFVPNLGAAAYDTIYGLPVAWSASGAFDTSICELITGDWNMVIVGMRQDIRVETSTEGTIVDGAGNVIVSAFQDNQVLMKVFARLGYVIGQPVTRRAGGPAFPFGLASSEVQPVIPLGQSGGGGEGGGEGETPTMTSGYDTPGTTAPGTSGTSAATSGGTRSSKAGAKSA